MNKEKRFEVDVNVKFKQVEFATSKAEAISQTKATFVKEFHLYITDKEIIKVEEKSNEQRNIRSVKTYHWGSQGIS